VSANKHFRNAWCATSYAEAVRLFHERRRLPESAERELAELARACANTVFQGRAHLILPGQEEVTARQFMRMCRQKFGFEIAKAAVEETEEEVELVS
jgi:adenylate cyclase